MKSNDLLKEDYLKFLAKHNVEPKKEMSSTEVEKMQEHFRQSFIKQYERREDPISKMMYEFLISNKSDKVFKDKNHEYKNVTQSILDEVVSESIESIKKSTKSNKYLDKIYVGTFPTQSINACAVLVENGYLILFDEGILNFIAQFSQVQFSQVTRIMDKQHSNMLEETSEILCELILCYLTNTPVSEIRSKLPKVRGIAATFQYEAMKDCIRFILCHELAHIAAGHLDGERRIKLNTFHGDIETLNISWAKEYEADLLSISMMFEYHKTRQKVNNLGAELNLAVNGAITFFCIDEYINSIYYYLTGARSDLKLNSTHPTANLRMKNIENYLIKIGLKETFNMASSNISMNKHYIKFSIDKLKEV